MARIASRGHARITVARIAPRAAIDGATVAVTAAAEFKNPMGALELPDDTAVLLPPDT